ncbi:hypothetical protein HMPREF3033_00191 [Veillonellaceae bacterium DNF00751]|nr:hypothetical protein HMPREF3033_00191 [Veillonellaceae bacterium DNF00751]
MKRSGSPKRRFAYPKYSISQGAMQNTTKYLTHVALVVSVRALPAVMFK